MAELKVIWTKRALAVFQKTAYWYAANLGIQFAVTFAKNTEIHIVRLRFNKMNK